jgi:hypothetical protein
MDVSDAKRLKALEDKNGKTGLVMTPHKMPRILRMAL